MEIKSHKWIRAKNVNHCFSKANDYDIEYS